MDLSDIPVPENARLTKEVQRLALNAPSPQIRDAVLLFGMLRIVGSLEARTEALLGRTEVVEQGIDESAQLRGVLREIFPEGP
ncbi:hypothetical protein [Mycobacterium avium]|uniref:hypothetical protein n=1 Tax=Mycobacterium avium TaxID=1764 RepID=UPI00102458D1|nr:hypothetical protein [Mycobacterium avium]QBC87351.1 hypothetical protein B6K05_023265 [Mycobacterium avium subsp. hominissuis]